MKSRTFAEILTKWYRKYGTELDWRSTKDPYRIWVSEIFLQQTQVSRVREYYERFLNRFPTLDSFAASRWQSVLPVWRGLGYYQRGRNMLQTAKLVRDEFDGCFPETYEELITLPGVGPYTASAILCFAFGEQVPALDTNLKRVIRRVTACDESQLESESARLFSGHRFSARNMNYALMDIGREICQARKVDCSICPFSKVCKARSTRSVECELERKKVSTRRKSTREVVAVGAGCIHRNGRYLLAKRPKSKGGEWEFPGGKKEPGESIRDCLKRELSEELGIEVAVRPHFATHEFRDGVIDYRLYFCRCQILQGKPKVTEHQELCWVLPADMKNLALAESNRNVIDRLRRFR